MKVDKLIFLMDFIFLDMEEDKEAIGWSLSDIKGIRLSLCMNCILLEDDIKPPVEAQR